MKNHLNSSIIYAIMGLAFGVFYREVTKYSGYIGATRLSLIHGHYLALGLFFFLFLFILEKQFAWSTSPKTKGIVVGYHVGLNITALGFLIRGISEVFGQEMSRGLNASISGISGIGHILIAVTMVIMLLRVRKKISQDSAA
jgi:hypothetical protein